MSFPNSHFCKKLVLNCFVQHTIICLSVNFFSIFFFILTFLTNCPAVVNAIIVVFYSFKIFLTSLPSRRLCQNFGLILSMVPGYKQMFFVADTTRKADNINRAMCFAHSAFRPSSQLKIQLKCPGIAVKTIFFFSSVQNKQLGSHAWK